MAKSKTKYQVTIEELKAIFAKHQLGEIQSTESLGNGEFNTAIAVDTVDGKSYVVKIAPPRDGKVLSYEKHMMESEVFWYGQIREHTKIIVPTVYASDFSEEILGAAYFIMEKMKGQPLWAVGFSEEEYAEVSKQKIGMLAQIHGIPSKEFGYRQLGLKATWYEAIREMAEKLVSDCEALGKATPDGHRLLECIDKHREILEGVSGCMVNFDLWDSNVLYADGRLCWIDPERSFWGDPIADFITLGKGQMTPLSEKLEEIRVYNETASHPIVYNREAEIRYQIAVAYLALIEEVEKYVRYEPQEENYIRNTVDAGKMYDMAFGVLY